MSDSEIVRRIAEKAMGWEVVERDSARHQEIILCETPELTNACMFIDGRLCKWTETRPGYIELVAFTPLKNIADAFQVVEKMWELGWQTNVSTPRRINQGKWLVTVFHFERDVMFSAREDSAPRAICLATLAAVEGK